MHVQVINLTRFGDLLQTQPVFSGLKGLGATTSLVCLDTFQGAAALLRDVDGVRPLPGARLLARLDRDWTLAAAELCTWLDSARDDRPDTVLNLTPTLAGRLLGRAFHGRDIQGFGLDDDGFGRYSTPWAVFLQAASTYRGCSPFNLVDLFQRVAGLEPGEFRLRAPGEEAMARAACLLAGAPGVGQVAFQLGASQDYRRWPVEAFVRAGRVLWSRTGRSPVLLGTAGEGHLARRFVELADYPCTDLTGRTDLPTLAAVLSRTDFLLTNDTGTMHLAAGLGVPVAAVFLATAQPFDTGPYLEGSLSLEPDLPCHPCSFGEACPHGLACREALDGAAVGELLTSFMTGGPTVPDGFPGRVWEARRDDRGYMNLLSLSGHGREDRSLWIAIQRDVYRQFLDQRQDAAAPAWPGGDSDFRLNLDAELERCSLMLTLLEEQGRLLALRPDSPVKARFLVNCRNLEDIFAANPSLGVLNPMWRYLSRDQAADMPAFLSQCAEFRDLLGALRLRLRLA
jgi:ADP-heptose:LPS heptosyltransferase